MNSPKQIRIYYTLHGTLNSIPIQVHLTKYQDQLSNRNEVKSGNHQWFALERPRSEIQTVFSKPKILYTAFQVKSAFSIDKEGCFTNNAIFTFPEADYYLLGCLNSKAVWFQINHFIPGIRGGYQLMFNSFSKVTIPAATPEQQAEIAALVEAVLAAKAAGQPTAALEADIDALVAARYGLTPAEAAQLSA